MEEGFHLSCSIQSILLLPTSLKDGTKIAPVIIRLSDIFYYTIPESQKSNFEFKKFPQSLQIFNLTSFKVNIAQTNIGYIPPLPKSIMALNISFNPIYDFDQGLDLTNSIHQMQPEGDRSTHSVIEKKMHL